MRLGKDKQATLLAVFLVFAASASGQTERSYKFHKTGDLQTTVVISDDHSIIINYSVPELKVKSLTNNAGAFFRISIPGHVTSSDPGKPELPVFSRLITIPDGSDFSIKISEVRTSKVSPVGKKTNGILYPAQESETKDIQQTRQDFKINKNIYATRGFISGDTVRIEKLGQSRASKLANLYISPVRYNPQTNILEVITSMKIEVTFSGSGSNVKSVPNERSFNETLDKGVLNYNPGKVIPGFSDQPVKMIILTDTAFKKQLQPFFRWKTQKGYKLTILYKGTKLAGDDYLHLKDTLTKIYKSSTPTDPPPEYLLIIGDVNRVPYFGTGTSGNITDMYYGEFDGNGDYIPDMFIGRIPAADTNEVKTAVSKIIQYEKFQFAPANNFYSRAVASAGYDDGYAGYMNGQLKYAYTNYLTKANGIDEYHFNYPESYTSKDSIIKLINKGISFLNYTGHGEALGWLHVNIKTPDIQTFDNKNMYPFIISNACRTAQFTLSNSFGVSMLLTADKGAIGFIGCSNDSYWDEDYYWAVGPGIISDSPTYETSGLGAYDRMFHTHNESPSDWYFTMGQINYAGNLAVSASTSSRKKYYWETYNLIGDPSVIPIMGKPGTFNITLPDTLPNGIKSISLNVDPFAYVAISHFDKLWDASYASASGTVSLNMPGVSNDSCLVVITGQNKMPIIKTIRISNIHKEFINLTASAINDSIGNNNKLADYGESLFLNLTLGNLGLSDAKNLTAKISSSSDLITITKDSVFIGTLSAGTNKVISDKFAITVTNNVPDMSVATLNLTLKDQLSQKHYTIDVLIHAPDLQIMNCTMDDDTIGNGDNIPDPGESFKLVFKVNNLGSSDVAGQFNISTTEPDFSIVEPSVKSGVLKFGHTTDIPVLVKLSQSIPSGSLITVSASLNCDPYNVNKNFTFRVGKIRESFEASSFNVFPWINISAIPWIITSGDSYDGAISARSGAIGNSQSTSLVIRTLYPVNDSVRFYYKVSSEPNYDYFSFKLNGTEIFKQSGEVPWKAKAVAVPAGSNTMEWCYKKDGTKSAGADCAWIDMIDFAQSSTIKYIQKDLNVARIVKPFRSIQYGLEDISVKVLNAGRDTLNGFNLAYELNNHIAIKQFFDNKVIPFGDSVTVTFKTKADLSKYGMYNVLVYGFGNKDDYSPNDSLSAQIDNSEISEAVSEYPNPFNDKFTITINSPIADRIQISLFSVSGVELYNVSRDIISGHNSFTIGDLKLSPSLYYLNILGTSIDKTIPVLKILK
jgi:hypothetical protein